MTPVQISTPPINISSPYIVVIHMFYHGMEICSVKKAWDGVKIPLRCTASTQNIEYSFIYFKGSMISGVFSGLH